AKGSQWALCGPNRAELKGLERYRTCVTLRSLDVGGPEYNEPLCLPAAGAVHWIQKGAHHARGLATGSGKDAPAACGRIDLAGRPMAAACEDWGKPLCFRGS